VGCECNDVDIDSVIISQSLFNIFDFVHNIETILVSSIQCFACDVNYFTILRKHALDYQKSPPDLLSKNSEIVKTSIILLI
jgi:hypothetical protein